MKQKGNRYRKQEKLINNRMIEKGKRRERGCIENEKTELEFGGKETVVKGGKKKTEAFSSSCFFFISFVI